MMISSLIKQANIRQMFCSKMSTMTITLQVHLLDVAKNNALHYRGDESDHGRRLHDAFSTLADHVGATTPMYKQIAEVMDEYDFDAFTPANGYRSLLGVADACVKTAVKVGEAVASKKDTVFFKKRHYTREAENASALVAALNSCLRAALELRVHSQNGDLYASDAHSPEFLRFADVLNTSPFYGRSLGFQFVKSLRGLLKQISVGMATYHEFYESNKWALPRSAVSLWKGGRFLNNPELRGKKLSHITKTATIDFLKSYWFLSESQLMSRVPFFVSPSIAVNRIITLHPAPLTHVTPDAKEVVVDVPTAHLGPQPLNVHLYSAAKHEGQGSGATSAMCKELIVHFHGGGFVAQSPRSHEIYLRDWAVQIKAPILSVDYTLAPSGAFPRPLQDAVWAYMWARQHCNELGSTGERVILAGDSAGANLSLTVALKCLEMQLPPPDGIFLAYFPALISFTPSPSRVLTCMDPILPYGFLVGCLNAYAGTSKKNSISVPDAGVSLNLDNMDGIPPSTPTSPTPDLETHDDGDLSVPRNPELSPWWASDDNLRRLPPISILTTELDPCLDDCVMFGRRMKRLDHDVTLDVVPGLPHGFLYFAMLNPEAKAGSDLCVKRMKQRLGIVEES